MNTTNALLLKQTLASSIANLLAATGIHCDRREWEISDFVNDEKSTFFRANFGYESCKLETGIVIDLAKTNMKQVVTVCFYGENKSVRDATAFITLYTLVTKVAARISNFVYEDGGDE